MAIQGTKALEKWCRIVTEGYDGVNILNMTTSWRNGLAFCAIIHHFRPELIDFASLDPEDALENNRLAFSVAEQQLGIPALLDPQDMAECELLDRLSILTYLSQFYQAFHGATAAVKTARTASTRSQVKSPSAAAAAVVVGRRNEPCKICSKPVFILERLNVAGRLLHRTCFKCARCETQLNVHNYYETESGGYCCDMCPDEEKNLADTVEANKKIVEEHLDSGVDESSSDSGDEESEGEGAERTDTATATGTPVPAKRKKKRENPEAAASSSSGVNNNDDGDHRDQQEDQNHNGLPPPVTVETEDAKETEAPSAVCDDEQDASSSNNNTAEPAHPQPAAAATDSNANSLSMNDSGQGEKEERTKSEEENSLTDKHSISSGTERTASPQPVPVITVDAADENAQDEPSETDRQDVHSTTNEEKVEDTTERGDESGAEMRPANEISDESPEPVVLASEGAEETKTESPELITAHCDSDASTEKSASAEPHHATSEDNTNEASQDDCVKEDPAKEEEASSTAEDPNNESYPSEMNPFGDDGDDENEPEAVKVEDKKVANDRKNEEIKTSSTNPFGSDFEDSEDEESSKGSATVQLRKAPPVPAGPAPPKPPRASLNPFGSDFEDDDDDLDVSNSSRRSVVSTPSPSVARSRKKRQAPKPPSAGASPAPSPRPRRCDPVPAPRSSIQPSRAAPPRPPSPAISVHSATASRPPRPPPPTDLNKLRKERDNQNRRSQVMMGTASVSAEPDSSIALTPLSPDKATVEGQWKRKKGPAPPRPIPQKRQVKKLPRKAVNTELHDIEIQQQELERQGVKLEKTIREVCEKNDRERSEAGLENKDRESLGPEVEDLIVQLFDLVNEKNELFRRQTELMYMKRDHRLEEEHADIEHQIRVLMAKVEAQKTEEDRLKEEKLIARLMEVVAHRNEIVDCLEMDRLREREEDESFEAHMGEYAALKPAAVDEEKAKKKLKKKKKKEKDGASKKGKKKKAFDADKDIDTSEFPGQSPKHLSLSSSASSSPKKSMAAVADKKAKKLKKKLLSSFASASALTHSASSSSSSASAAAASKKT